VISNCVINLSVVKPSLLSEMFRVLAPRGTTRQATTPTMSDRFATRSADRSKT